ncbi:MAG: hypothetical protein RL648_524 [Verrucomicrobiota bacterium]
MRLQWVAIGCPCELVADVTSEAERRVAEAAFREVWAWLTDFEARYSRFKPESQLSRLNSGAGSGWQAVDPEMADMLELCDWAYFQSRQCLDATALPVVKLYYRAEAAPDLTDVARAMEAVGWRRIQRRPDAVWIPHGMSLDFGGFGKEYAVDVAAMLLEEAGLRTWLVNFGNDIRVSGSPRGAPGWVIGMEDPFDVSRMVKRLMLTKGGVAASGNYRRRVILDGQSYGHIVDPRTGRPARTEVVAVHVTAPTALQAGVLSTAAVILGLQEGKSLIESCEGAEAFFMCETTVDKTKGLTCYDP